MAARYAPEKDYYAVLGVEPTASADQINAAYRARVLIAHPERFDRHAQPEEWEAAQEILHELNVAYSILGEAHSRADYDVQRWEHRRQPLPGKRSTGRAKPDFTSYYSAPYDNLPATFLPRTRERAGEAKGIGRLVGLSLIVACALAASYWMSGDQPSWLGVAILLVLSCVAVPAIAVFIGSLSFAQESLVLTVAGIIFFVVTLRAIGTNSTAQSTVLLEAMPNAPKEAVTLNAQPRVERYRGNDRLYPDAATRRLRDVASISYRGIGFKTTHLEFLQKFPHARRANAGAPSPVVSYCMIDKDGQQDAVWFQFYGDDLLCLGYTYETESVNRYGGDTVLLDHARARFGPPTQEDPTVTVWLFPEADRTIRAGWDGSNWCLLITRDSIAAKVADADRSEHGSPQHTTSGKTNGTKLFAAENLEDGQQTELCRLVRVATCC